MSATEIGSRACPLLSLASRNFTGFKRRLTLVLTALAAFVASTLLTRAIIPWLADQGAVATENERTMHQGRVPKGGGVALLIAAVATAAMVSPVRVLDPVLIIGTAILAYLSWRDDLAPLPASIRLAVHLGVAALFVLNLPSDALIFQGWLPLPLDRLLGIIGLGWLMNLYNFMDGINGIVGVETVAITLGYVLIGATASSNSYDALAVALMGASAGFLLWNMRAKPLVFLGDVGSVPLGFLMGALMIDLAVKGHWAAALILPSYFLADATLTLLMRLMRGEKPWQAHKTHFYQRAAAALGSHVAAVMRIAIANVALIGAAVWSLSSPWLSLATAALIVVALLYALSRHRT